MSKDIVVNDVLYIYTKQTKEELNGEICDGCAFLDNIGICSVQKKFDVYCGDDWGNVYKKDLKSERKEKIKSLTNG